MSKLSKLKSVFSKLDKINVKNIQNNKSDLSEINSMNQSSVEKIESDYSNISKGKNLNITSLNSDLSNPDVFKLSDVSTLKSDLSNQSSMDITDLSSLKRVETSKFIQTDITTLKSNSNFDVPNKNLNQTDVAKFDSENKKIKDFNKSKLVDMVSDLSTLSNFKKTNLRDSQTELDDIGDMNQSDITTLNSPMSETLLFGKSDITSFASIFNTLEVFNNSDITTLDSDYDNLIEMNNSDITDIDDKKLQSFNNTDVTTLGDTTDLDDAITTPYNTDQNQTIHATGTSLQQSELDDISNPLGQILDVMGTLSTSALSPIHDLANIGFTDFWNDGRIFNDYMQQNESAVVNDTDYSPEFSNYQWPGPVNFISKTHYGHAAPSGFTLNEYQKAPTHIDVIDDVTSEYFPYNKDLELNMYSSAEHTINEAAYRFPFADGADQKLYDTYKYDPRHSIMPDLIFNVNPYLGTMFDDNLGGLFNTVEDTTDTTHKYSSVLKTINKPSMDTIIESGNLMSGGTGHVDAAVALENYSDSGGIFGWEEAPADGTFSDNIGSPHSVSYWNGSQINLNVWYFSGLDGETPFTAGFNPLMRGLTETGGVSHRTIQFGYDVLDTLGDQGKLGEGALSFETLYSDDPTIGATDNKQGRYTDRLKLKGDHPWTNATNRGKEPYMTFPIGSDDNDGTRGWSTFDRASIDENRMWNFIMNSSAGGSWLTWQFVLQFLNPRSSRLFNPISPQINTGGRAGGLKLQVNRGWLVDMLLGNEIYANTVYEIEHGSTPESNTVPKGNRFPKTGNNLANFRSGGIVFQVIGDDNVKGKTVFKNVGSTVATSPDQLWNFPLMDWLRSDDTTALNLVTDLTSLGSYPLANRGRSVMVKGQQGHNPVRGLVRGATTDRAVTDVTPAIRFSYTSTISNVANNATSNDDPMKHSFGGKFSLASAKAQTTRPPTGDKVRLSRTYEEIPDYGSDSKGRYLEFLKDKQTVQSSVGPSWKTATVVNGKLSHAFRLLDASQDNILNSEGTSTPSADALYRLGDFMTMTPIVQSPANVMRLANGKMNQAVANAGTNTDRIKGSFQGAMLQNNYSEDNDPESERHGMPFYFKDLRDGSYITFRAYLEGMSETIAPQWEEQSYVGRSEPLHSYGSTTRSLSFGLRLIAGTRDELMAIYEKMNALTSLCYPEYKHDTAWHQSWAGVDDPGSTNPNTNVGINLLGKMRMKAPLAQLRIGEYYGSGGVDNNGFDRAQTGFIESLSYTIEDTSPWETQKQYRVPKYILANIGFKVLHMKVPELNLGKDKYPFYGINKNVRPNTNQVWPGGSQHPNRDITQDLPNYDGDTNQSIDAFDSADLYSQ